MADAALAVVMSLDDDDFTTKIVAVGGSLGDVNVQINQFVANSSTMDASVRNLGASFASWSLALNMASEAFRELSSVTTEWAEKIIEVNNSVQQTTILLQGLSKAGSEAGRAMDASTNMQGLMDLAGNSPYKLETLTDTFVKLKTAGIDPMNGSMKALMDSIAAFGGDDSRLQRAGYAIQEMAGRGVISLQNLRRQLGQDIPGAVALMARSMNMTIEELDQKVQSGTLASGHALNLMLEEFQRTYGGATGQLMQTFEGRVSQLTNSLQRLALVAGGQVKPNLQNLFGDMNPETQGSMNNSAYTEAVSQISKINDMMKTPEMVASAVTVNNALKSMATTAGEVVRAFIEWRDPILKTAEVLGGLATALVTVKVATLAYEVAASAISTVIGIPDAVLVGFEKLVAVLQRARVAVVTMGAAMIDSVAPGAAAAVLATSELSVAALGLTAAFAVIAVPVGIIAGLAAIANHMAALRGQTEMSDDAMKRLLQGDITAGNVSKAQADLVQLTQHIQAMRVELENLNKDQATVDAQGGINSNNRNTSANYGGFAAISGMTDQINEAYNKLGMVSGENFDKYKAQVQQQLAQLQIDQRDVQAAAAAAPAEALAAQSKSHFDQMIAGMQAGFQTYETAYRQQMDAISKQREELAAEPGNHRDQVDTLNDQSKGAAIEEMIGFNAIMQQMIAQETAYYNQAIADKNKSEIAFYKDSLTRLQDYQKQKIEEMQKGANDQGTPASGAGQQTKDNATALREAGTELEGLEQKAAVLEARLNDTGTASAKLGEQLKQVSWQNVGTELIEQLTTAAAKVDGLSAAMKAETEIEKAHKNIDNGFEKATEQVALYTAKIANAGLPEAQQKVMELQLQMNQQLDAAANAFNIAGASTASAAEKLQLYGQFLGSVAQAQQAFNTQLAASTLAQVYAHQTEAHKAYLNSLSAGARAVEVAKDRDAEHATILDNLKKSLDAGTLSQEAYNNAVNAENTSHTTDLTTTTNKLESIGAKAAKPGDDAVKQLNDKLEELRGTIIGGESALDEWNEKIAQSPAIYAKNADAIRELAAQLDTMKKAVSVGDAGNKALASLNTTAQTAEETRNLEEQEQNVLSVRGRVLSIEKQILDYKIRQNAEVAKVKAQENNAQVVASKGAGVIAQQVATAESDAALAEQDNTVRLLRDDMANLTTETEDGQKKGANAIAGATLAIQQQVDAYDKIIAASKESAQQQQQDMNTVASWAAMKDNDILQKNQSMLQKLVANWNNEGNDLTKFGETMFTSFNDALAKMVTTGKADWKQFVDNAIEELVKLILKMAEAQAMATLLSALGIGQTSVIGVASVAANSGSSFAPLSAPASETVALGNHAGGIVGSEATFSRLVNSSVFNNAVRYHTGGIAGDEIPTILQQGEGVFTAGQMGSIGDMNAGFSAMAAAVAAMASSMTKAPTNAVADVAPQHVTPPSGYTGSNGAGQNIAFNVNNQTGLQLQAQQTGSRYESEQMIVDIVLKHVQQPGTLRSAIKGA